jgi:hypothetical protein
MKKRKPHSHRARTTPRHGKLPWPGLKAKDHLSRVVTRAVKEAKETRENEQWAENQIGRVLDYVPTETAMRMLFREARRRRKPNPRFAKALLRVLEAVESAGGIYDGGTCAPQKKPHWLELGKAILEMRDALKQLSGGSARLTI